MDQTGKDANPALGQLNRDIPLSPCVPENLVSRDGFSRPVPRQPAHPHTQAESGAYLRDSSRVPRRRPFMKPPYAIGSGPSLSGHAIAYRWRSLPRVRRDRASKPQDSSKRVLPWQITMDQLIFACLSHTHYWYEVGMLKVPPMRWMGSESAPSPTRSQASTSSRNGDDSGAVPIQRGNGESRVKQIKDVPMFDGAKAKFPAWKQNFLYLAKLHGLFEFFTEE